MILIYGECRKNSVLAVQMYTQRFPERRHPSRHYFKKLERKMRREPRVQNQEFIVNEELEINVLGTVSHNRSASVREIAEGLGSNRETVRRILKKHNYRSLKYNLHQHLYEGDSIRRIVFCEWLINKFQRDNNFAFNILFSDESRFTNNAMFNRQNVRYWSQQNQRLVRQGRFQERFGINVWAGIYGTRIIGPIFFQGTLTGQRYLEFLQNQIWQEIQEIPLAQYRLLYFQQDGAPPHNSRVVMDYLNETYGPQLISNQGHIRWPARSPDLTPLDFFLWGYIKGQVYKTPVMTIEDLEFRIRRAFNSITPQMLRNVTSNTIVRARRCIDCDGGHFEQYL